MMAKWMSQLFNITFLTAIGVERHLYHHLFWQDLPWSYLIATFTTSSCLSFFLTQFLHAFWLDHRLWFLWPSNSNLSTSHSMDNDSLFQHSFGKASPTSFVIPSLPPPGTTAPWALGCTSPADCFQFLTLLVYFKIFSVSLLTYSKARSSLNMDFHQRRVGLCSFAI